MPYEISLKDTVTVREPGEWKSKNVNVHYKLGHVEDVPVLSIKVSPEGKCLSQIFSSVREVSDSQSQSRARPSALDVHQTDVEDASESPTSSPSS